MAARTPWLTIAVAAVAAVATALPGAAGALELSRDGLARGELWRLATGHLVHWSAGHALWDVVTFLGLGVLCERRSRSETACVLGFAPPVVSLVVLAVHPDLASYRGLSALDVALFALLGLQLGGGIGVALGGLLAAKLGWEAASGVALFVGEPGAGAVLVPVAHAAGAAAALTAFRCARLASGWRPAPRARGPKDADGDANRSCVSAWSLCSVNVQTGTACTSAHGMQTHFQITTAYLGSPNRESASIEIQVPTQTSSADVLMYGTNESASFVSAVTGAKCLRDLGRRLELGGRSRLRRAPERSSPGLRRGRFP